MTQRTVALEDPQHQARADDEPARQPRGRPRSVDAATVERMVEAHVLEGVSLSQVGRCHDLPKSTVQSIIDRHLVDLEERRTKTQPEGRTRTEHRVLVRPQQLSRAPLGIDARCEPASTRNFAGPEDECIESFDDDIDAFEGDPSSLLQGRESCYALPEGDRLREGITQVLCAEVTRAVERGDTHPIWWSPTPAPDMLADVQDRQELLRLGRAPCVAFKGWAPLMSLRRVLDKIDAEVGIAAVDFREAGPHFHVEIVVPRSVTPKMIDDLWAAEMGSRAPGPYWNRCMPLTHWELMLRAQAGLREDFDWQLGAALRGVGNLVNYTLKGADSSRPDLVHAIMPRAVRVRPASDFLVWARGVSVDGVDLGEFIEARFLSAPDVEVGSVEITCERCRDLVSVVRCKDRKRDPRSPPKKLRKVRTDRDYCSDACRHEASRAHRGVLAIIGRIHRQRRWDALDQTTLDATWCGPHEPARVGHQVEGSDVRGRVDAR